MQNPLWFSWRELALGARFFLLVLASTSIYVVLSAAIVLRRVHSYMNGRQSEDASTQQRSVNALQARCLNMGQLITSVFYLFGFVFFMLLPAATWILGSGKTPVSWLILENFLHDFAYAANVFLIFFVLSLIQWFVSAWVRACALRLNTVP